MQVTCGATFNGMMRYTFDIVGGGVDAVEAHCISWPNKCVRLGWGIFILILLSSYTANLAAFLTATAGRNMTMKDIDEVIDNGITICTHLVVTGQVNKARLESLAASPCRHFPMDDPEQIREMCGSPSLKRVSVSVLVVAAGLLSCLSRAMKPTSQVNRVEHARRALSVQISHADSVSSSPGHNQCAKCQSIAHPDSACLLVTLVNWCAWAGADPQMRALYPKAVFKFYSSASRTVNGYLDGECGALTITKLQLAFSQVRPNRVSSWIRALKARSTRPRS
jgi:hypothetical protein